MRRGNAKGHGRLPSLDLLAGFEAAARLLSFTRAAAELHLTQSAVSRQVKELEEQLGTALFRRRHRALELTEAGRTMHAAATQVLATVRAAAERLRALDGERVLSVTTSVTFAAMWLVPRLAGFTRANPGVDVRVSADARRVDLERAGIDLALRYSTQALAGAGALRLFGERVFPVCSPRLLEESRKSLGSPADLRHFPLLHIDDPEGQWPWMAWRTWFEVAGVMPARPAGNLRFTNYSEVIAAAIAGQGVALGRSPLVREALRAGRLVAPFGIAGESSRAYWLIVARDAAERPEVKRFAAWVKAEARRWAEPRGMHTAREPSGR